jgi:hypothetical protein
MRRSRGPATQLVVRIPRDLAVALDRELRRERTARPGERITMADVVRRILARAVIPPAEVAAG